MSNTLKKGIVYAFSFQIIKADGVRTGLSDLHSTNSSNGSTPETGIHLSDII